MDANKRLKVVNIAESIVLEMQGLVEFDSLEGSFLIVQTYFKILGCHECAILFVLDTRFSFHDVSSVLLNLDT